MAQTISTQSLQLEAAGVILPGDLAIPAGATGLVIFAHGSGSSRLSPRNRQVAEWLNQSGLATLLFDLLTRVEESVDAYTAQLRFDIELLARRLAGVTDWMASVDEVRDLPVGYFGASTGAAAALVAAASRPERIRAVVSRGGRPDLAGRALADVKAATLLIVGEYDATVIRLNQEAMRQLTLAHKELVIVPGASHLFEEHGTLEQAGEYARRWFSRYLTGASLDQEREK
jgi:dienelactone hydrolase